MCVCVCAVERMGSFTARNLANALWGLARLEHAPNTLLAAACQQVTLRVGQANPQNVSNTLWALGSLSYNPGAHTKVLRPFPPHNSWARQRQPATQLSAEQCAADAVVKARHARVCLF